MDGTIKNNFHMATRVSLLCVKKVGHIQSLPQFAYGLVYISTLSMQTHQLPLACMPVNAIATCEVGGEIDICNNMISDERNTSSFSWTALNRA